MYQVWQLEDNTDIQLISWFNSFVVIFNLNIEALISYIVIVSNSLHIHVSRQNCYLISLNGVTLW